MTHDTTRTTAPSERLRTLIVGAGIAGLTLAALLRQRGGSPVVVDRQPRDSSQGYMLGLYPIGARVLHGLGAYDAYAEDSTPMREYDIGNGNGELIRTYALDEVTRRFGPIRGVGRDELIRILLDAAGDADVRFETTAVALRQDGDAVEVTFSDGTTETFDLVVAADGLHSETRSRVLDDDDVDVRDTGWGGWIYWTDPDLARDDTFTEYWGAGRFVGLYPVKDRLGVFIGGPTDETAAGFSAFAGEATRAFDHPIPALEDAQRHAPDDSYFWAFHDCRAKRWRRGRVVLLGDAAVGFLPTAGVGASMAMESAAVLADELSRTSAARVEQALDLYERRHRNRVEKAQTGSRRLGRMMFVRSAPLAWARDRALKLYTVEQLVQGIAGIMETPA